MKNTPAPGLEPNAGDRAVEGGGKALGVLEPGPRPDTGLQRPSPGSKSGKNRDQEPSAQGLGVLAAHCILNGQQTHFPPEEREARV